MADRAGGRERPVAWYLGDHAFLPGQSDSFYFHRREAGHPARRGSLGTVHYMTSYDVGLARIRAYLRPRTSRTPSSRAVRCVTQKFTRLCIGRHQRHNETQWFYLRIHRPGYYRWKARRPRGWSLAGAGLHIMRSGKTVLTNRAVQFAMRSAATTPVRLATLSVAAGVKAAA
jgi:hypothetical protein